VIFSDTNLSQENPVLVPESLYPLPSQSIYQEKGATMQKANARNGQQRWTRWCEGESYPVFVVYGRCIEGESFEVWCKCSWKEKK
jgi:hypothetical protein